MCFAFALQLLGLGLVVAGAPLTGAGCCLVALALVAGERMHDEPRG